MWPPPRLAELSTRLEDALGVRWARHILQSCDVVGEHPRVRGSAVVANDGRIEIGSDFALSSIPVCSHLATGPSGRLIIGDGVRIAHGASVFAYELIEIGDGTTIGPMAMLLDVDFHEIKSRESMGASRPIRIGRNVRIGSGVVVLRGAIIGDGAHIAANSVVARAVPPGVHAEGVPARPITAPPPTMPSPSVGTSTLL